MDECMTLWGEPERSHVSHMQNINREQLNVHDCH